MKKLFTITDTHTNKSIGQFFDDRMAAKAVRKQLNPKDDSGNEQFRYVVSLGPDHRLYKRN
jgi:hypothetical protein